MYEIFSANHVLYSLECDTQNSEWCV